MNVESVPEPKKGLAIGQGKLLEKSEDDGQPTLKSVGAKPVEKTTATLAPQVRFHLC